MIENLPEIPTSEEEEIEDESREDIGFLTRLSSMMGKPETEISQVEDADLEELALNPLLTSSPHESILESGVPASSSELNGGANETILVNIVDDGSGIFKPQKGERDLGRRNLEVGTYYKRERAAYLVSKLMMFDLVPPTVIRSIDGKVGSVQQFIEDTQAMYEIGDSGTEKLKEDFIKLLIFDYVIWNTDRHFGNFLVKDGSIVAIDHGCSLHGPFDNRIQDTLAIKGDWWSVYDKDVPSDIIENYKKYLEWDKDNEILRSLLGELVNEEEAEACIDRVQMMGDVLLKHGKIPSSEIENLTYSKNEKSYHL